MLMTFDTKQECVEYIRRSRLRALPHVSNAFSTMGRWIVVIPHENSMWALLEDGETMELLDW